MSALRHGPGIDHEFPAVGRNASRWLRQLDRFDTLRADHEGAVRVNWKSQDA